jgi:hypothetical protein
MPHPPLPAALGFRWGLPYLLSTPLRIRQEASRVHSIGLRRDGLGGVLLGAPSALCGSPVVTEGTQVDLCHLRRDLYTIPPRSCLPPSAGRLQARLADLSGKVGQGVGFP